MSAEVAAEQPGGGLAGDVPGGDHRELELAVERAPVDPLGLDQRQAGQQVLHVEGRAQHQHAAVGEPGQPQLELTEPGRRPDGVVPAGGDGAQGDDPAHARPAERVHDRPAHRRAGGRELRVGDHVGQHHQGRLDVLEQHAEVPGVGQVAGHDLGPPLAQPVERAPVLQDPHRLTLA